MGVSQIGGSSAGGNLSGIQLRHTVTGTGPVSIPSATELVYAVVVGGGGGGMSNYGGGAGAIVSGWVTKDSLAIVGAGGAGSVPTSTPTASRGGFSKFSNLVAGGGGGAASGPNSFNIAPNYFGIPSSVPGMAGSSSGGHAGGYPIGIVNSVTGGTGSSNQFNLQEIASNSVDARIGASVFINSYGQGFAPGLSASSGGSTNSTLANVSDIGGGGAGSTAGSDGRFPGGAAGSTVNMPSPQGGPRNGGGGGGGGFAGAGSAGTPGVFPGNSGPGGNGGLGGGGGGGGGAASPTPGTGGNGGPGIVYIYY